MPIFEYICRECGKQFEVLVRGETIVQCPDCSGEELEKQLSVFAASVNNEAQGRQLPIPACGTCGDPRGPGSCSMN